MLNFTEMYGFHIRACFKPITSGVSNQSTRIEGKSWTYFIVRYRFVNLLFSTVTPNVRRNFCGWWKHAVVHVWLFTFLWIVQVPWYLIDLKYYNINRHVYDNPKTVIKILKFLEKLTHFFFPDSLFYWISFFTYWLFD